MRVFAYLIAVQALAFGLNAPAMAADMFSMEDEACGSWKDGPCEKPALWNGFYVGGFIGGGWGSSDVADEYYYDDKDPLALNSMDLKTLIAGLNVGYNVQNGNFVFGVEAGLGFMNLSGSVTDDDLRPEVSNWDPAWGSRSSHFPISATYDFSGNLFGELTGKLGYATDKSMFYLKGGGAFVQANFDAHYEGETFSSGAGNCYWHGCTAARAANQKAIFDFGKDDTLLGWTVGLGYEQKISDRMSVKLEYQHYDFGSIAYDYSGTDKYYQDWQATLVGDVEADLTLDVVKLGVNYKLQGE